MRPVTPLSLLTARLDALCAREGLAPDVASELEAVRALAAGLDPYLERCTTPASPALEALAAATRERAFAGALEAEMLSGHVEGQFLKLLVHVTRAARVLDIGLFTGYSALAMAEALPAGGVVVACELDAEVARVAQAAFAATPAGQAIHVEVAPAGDTLARLAAAGEPFDLIFLDADKAGYLDYLGAILDGGLLAPHGLVCADNTLLQGEPYLAGDPSGPGAAIARFNAAVAADPRVEQVLVPLRDGVTLIRHAP